MKFKDEKQKQKRQIEGAGLFIYKYAMSDFNSIFDLQMNILDSCLIKILLSTEKLYPHIT